ncbi:MAG: OmpW family outer membrane protein [Gammaproteobacteria bacterium]
MIKKTVLATAIATSLFSLPVFAYQAGDFIARVGAAGVFPTGDSDSLDVLPDANVEAQSAWSLGLSLSYMVTDNIGVGILGSWPFEHDVDPKGSDLKGQTGSDSIATTKHLPPTVTAQWHFPTGSNIHPYVGLGFNYTYFFDEDTDGALSAADIDIEDSFGLALEAGLDVEVQDGWVVSGQVWYISIEPEAKVTGSVDLPVGTVVLDEKIDVNIDPWVFMVSIGKKF